MYKSFPIQSTAIFLGLTIPGSANLFVEMLEMDFASESIFAESTLIQNPI